MPEGRIHKCGTLVEEQEVEIDIRAEYTISLRNSKTLLQLIDKTKSKGILKPFLKSSRGMLEHLQQSEEEYRKRLQLISRKCNPYPEEWDPLKEGMNIKKMGRLGVILTAARQPELYFPDAS